MQGSAAPVTQPQQEAAAEAAASSSGRQQLPEVCGAVRVTWRLNQAVTGSISVDSAAALQLLQQLQGDIQQQRQQLQEMMIEVCQALQQLLASQKLQDWVEAASAALPLRWCCNHPGCSNLGTAGSKARGSELRRVGGRQCSKCKCACYCSKVCLGAHWEQHQKVCKSIRKQQEQAKAQQRGCNVLHTYDGFAQPPA
uniref:MYND-type domain-containing protein n=1 Tax=Tetradesmus obliquus TaxID=3088 RepID=A0A383V7J8_TETOB|eukprot:jgi/Sobl393_1/16279/SZX61565.1